MGEVVTISGDVGKRDGFATISASDVTGTATRGR